MDPHVNVDQVLLDKMLMILVHVLNAALDFISQVVASLRVLLALLVCTGQRLALSDWTNV
tara:strand:+ start:65 stop:244 length:180 start_codon:yes stop_codon:yes gene_type:complete